MEKKKINTLILLSCNAGHQDYQYANPAYKLFNKNNISQLVAYDGTHYSIQSKFKVALEVRGDDTYKSYLKKNNKKRKSKGFIVYKTKNKKTTITSIGSKFNSIDKLLSKIGKW